jgi:hypothetical protein
MASSALFAYQLISYYVAEISEILRNRLVSLVAYQNM